MEIKLSTSRQLSLRICHIPKSATSQLPESVNCVDSYGGIKTRHGDSPKSELQRSARVVQPHSFGPGLMFILDSVCVRKAIGDWPNSITPVKATMLEWARGTTSLPSFYVDRYKVRMWFLGLPRDYEPYPKGLSLLELP